MRESGIDVPVRLLARAHALQPVIGMVFEVVALMDRRDIGTPRNRHWLRLRFAAALIEDHVAPPPAARLRLEPPLRTPLAAGRVERAARAPDDGVVAITIAERRAVGVQNLLLLECG